MLNDAGLARWGGTNESHRVYRKTRPRRAYQAWVYGFGGSGGAYQAVDLYKRMSQASKKGAIFDDVLRFARLWAEKQTSTAERRETKRTVKKGGNQAGLF